MIVDDTSYITRRPRRSIALNQWWVILVLTCLTAAMAYYVWCVNQTRQRFSLKPIPPQTVSEGDLLIVQCAPQWHGSKPKRVHYSILSGPPDATIDPETGRWQWTPGELDGGRSVIAKVDIQSDSHPIHQSVCPFQITVTEHHRPPRVVAIPEQIVIAGETLDLVIAADDPDSPASKLEFRLGNDAPSDAILDPQSGRLQWTPPTSVSERFIPILASKSTTSGPLTTRIQVPVTVLEPFPSISETEAIPASSAPITATRTATRSPEQSVFATEFIKSLVQLHAEGKLLTPAGYTALRSQFAKRFTAQHAQQLDAILKGPDRDLDAWLSQHADHRDELYTAFVPEDDVAAGLRLVQRLHTKSFRRLHDYFELAIAIAVTWDRESGIYDYSIQQRRSHATVAAERAFDAIDNFDYYSDASIPSERRIRKLPWEFLTHVVNHRTPLEERMWVWRNYAEKRAFIGQCYNDVQYDQLMINSGETTSHLAAKPYTLPNLKNYGGICVVQADFATRVAKCMGTPAAYVEGLARSGGNHAWVMWTELQTPSNQSIEFSLQSHGRFLLDRYYVGQLLEPQSGRLMNDRELELKLESVGLNPFGYRQARLIMLAWPELNSELNLSLSEELDFLESVTKLNPGCQPAWRAIAKISRAGNFEPAMKQRFSEIRDRCYKTFLNCPDFLCLIIDDLLAYESDLGRRLPQYERLMQQWTNSGRRDLVCRLRGQLADLQVANGQVELALAGLALTMKRFPDEGRIIPRLIDKYESVARRVPDGSQKVLKLYQELMPLIPRRRQGQPSPFYLEMLARASRRFQQAGEIKSAQAYADQLKKLRE